VLHIALRLGHVTAVQLVLNAPNFDVVKCDSFQTQKVELWASTYTKSGGPKVGGGTMDKIIYKQNGKFVL